MLKSALTLLALVLVLPYACAPVYRFAEARPFSGDRFYNPYASDSPPAWQRANLHAHGVAWLGITSAKQTDSEVAAAYRAHGYDLAVVSDYQRIADASALPVYEHGFNVGKHHQLAIGARQVTWFDLPLWQSTSDKQYIINEIAANAALVAIAHPAALQGYAYGDDELAELSGYQLLEAINGHFTTESSWDAALSAGRAVWVIGDDDTHDVTSSDRFAVAWNMIGSATTQAAEIIDSLRRGRSYAVLSTGAAETAPRVSGVNVKDGVLTVSIAGGEGEFTFIGQNGDVKRTVARAASASYTFGPNDPYIRTRVKSASHVLFLNPIVRFDGRSLPTPTATIDAPWTFAARLGIFAFASLLVASIVRRHTGRGGRGRLDQARLWRRVASWTVLLAASAARANAQDAPKPLPNTLTRDTPFESVFDAALLPALPIADSVFTLIETTNVETISERISTGGLGFGSAPRFSAFGSSITQTRYRLGDVDITDPAGGGTPMFLPELNVWQRVSVSTGASGVTDNNPGLTITLEPRRPTATWTTTAEGSTTFGDAFTATPPSFPAIASLAGWNRGSVVASGPISPERAGIVVAGAVTRESEILRGAAPSASNNVSSLFAHLFVTASPIDEVRTLGVVQRTDFPAANPAVYASTAPASSDTSVHLQSTWLHDEHGTLPWRLFGAYTQRNRTPQATLATSATIERLTDGLPTDLGADTGARTDRRITVGARASTKRGTHALAAGADLQLARSSLDPGFAGLIGELVDGAPGRLWRFTAPSVASHRGESTVSLFAGDRFALTEHASVDVGLRFEHLSASADGAAGSIGWSSVLPHAMLRARLSEARHIDWFVGGGISAYQLPLDTLAWGDPGAPSIDVYRWAGGPLVPSIPRLYNVGPGGTGRIDPNLNRPYSNDLTFGVTARPIDRVAVELAALCRWDRELFGVVNASPNAPRYSTVEVADPGLDLPNASDDQVLHVFNYVLPGATPYLFDNVLTNPADATARRLGAKLTIEYTGERLFVVFGAAAYEADGRAASRGFQSSENDAGLVGEDPLFPNATIYDRGRLFGDRAFAGKVSAVYRFPADVTLGAIARYHDGQPFARIVVVPNLNQGTDFVRAFDNGGSRFTFTATLDVRLQKTFAVQRYRVAGFIDGYNLTNRGDEVEERDVTGAAFRTPTAFQPPRTFRVGARVEF